MKTLFRLACLAAFAVIGGIVLIIVLVTRSQPAAPVAIRPQPNASPASIEHPEKPQLPKPDALPAADLPIADDVETSPGQELLEQASKYESAEYDVPATLIAAASLCEKQKVSPERLFRTTSKGLSVGLVAYLAEAADVIAVLDDQIQVSLASGATAFVNVSNTRGFVTGESIALGLVYVAGTERYTSLIGGSQSGWVLDMITPSRWEDAQLALKQAKEINARNTLRDEIPVLLARINEEHFDALTSADGKHTTEAHVLSYSDGAVQLRKRDGTEVSVSMEKLHQDTQAKIRNRIADLSRRRTRLDHIKKELGLE